MPKKTKREKVLTEYRKRMKLLEQLGLSEKSVTSRAIPSTISKDIIDSSPQEAEIEVPVVEDVRSQSLKAYFLKDLRKSLMLIAGIIALEIIVYSGTISNYFGKLFKF